MKNLQELLMEASDPKEFKVGDILVVKSKFTNALIIREIIKMETDNSGKIKYYSGHGKWEFLTDDEVNSAHLITPAEIKELKQLMKLCQKWGYLEVALEIENYV